MLEIQFGAEVSTQIHWLPRTFKDTDAKYTRIRIVALSGKELFLSWYCNSPSLIQLNFLFQIFLRPLPWPRPVSVLSQRCVCAQMPLKKKFLRASNKSFVLIDFGFQIPANWHGHQLARASMSSPVSITWLTSSQNCVTSSGDSMFNKPGHKPRSNVGVSYNFLFLEIA